jgi:hypothetical protein
MNIHIYLQLSGFQYVARQLGTLELILGLAFQERNLQEFLPFIIMSNDNSTEVVLEGGSENHSNWKTQVVV